MANFDGFDVRMTAAQQAYSIIPLIRNIYQGCKQLQAYRALYATGNDPAFNAAVNAIHNTPEFEQIRAIILLTNQLATALETTHMDALTAR